MSLPQNWTGILYMGTGSTGSAINDYLSSNTIVTLYYVTTTGALSQVNSTNPFNWATADSLTITGIYQSA